MVEDLRVALVHVGVALGVGQCRRQVRQAGGVQGLHGRGVGEVVQVAGHHDPSLAVDREDRLDEALHHSGLLATLRLTGQRRRLVTAEQRVVAALGVPVVGDHEQRLGVEGELADQRLAAGTEGGVGRVDPPGVVAEVDPVGGVAAVGDAFRRRGVAGSAGGEGQPDVGAVEETHPDVAAGLTTIGIVHRVDLLVGVGRPARGADRVDQLGPGLVGGDHRTVGGPVVVLDLLDADDPRRGQVGHDLAGQAVELALRVGRVQVLDVERGNRDLARARPRGALRGQPAVHPGDRAGQQQVEVGKRVVEHTGRGAGEVVAHVHPGGNRAGEDGVVDHQPLRVSVGLAQHDAAAVGAHRRVRAVVTEHRDLVVAVAGADRDRVVHLDAHALQGFVEVDAVGGHVEGARGFDTARGVVVDHGRGRYPAAGADHRGCRDRSGAQHGDRRGGDLSGGQVRRGGPARPVLRHGAADRDLLADADRRCAGGVHEHTLGGGVARVRARVLEPEAGALHRGDDAADVRDRLAVQR